VSDREKIDTSSELAGESACPKLIEVAQALSPANRPVLYAIALMRAEIRLLYRAAVFFLMMPHFAERSIRENVAGSTAWAALASFFSNKRRTDRI
jgi:hypothetical protein